MRGYYHWSLFDNFEWANGLRAQVRAVLGRSRRSYARTPTAGATVLGEIAGARKLTSSLRAQWGGLGSMIPEGTAPVNGVCAKQ